jgi:hypothetical protein
MQCNLSRTTHYTSTRNYKLEEHSKIMGNVSFQVSNLDGILKSRKIILNKKYELLIMINKGWKSNK